MSWTDEKVAKLKELWGKGNTASQIAEIIGGISRNAVIGKAHRLNLSAKIKTRAAASNESFDVAAGWLYKGMGEAFDNNTARMAVAGDDPMLLSDMDPEKVGRANKAKS